MIFFTLISKIRPGTSPLLLCSSAYAEKYSEELQKAKLVISKLKPDDKPSTVSFGRSLPSRRLVYIVQDSVCFVAFVEHGDNDNAYFGYLHEVADSFFEKYTKAQIQNARRPFEMAAFESEIVELSNLWNSRMSKTGDSVSKIQKNLEETTAILKQNLEDLLERDSKLDDLTETSNSIVTKSNRYKQSAKAMRLEYLKKNLIPILVLAAVILLVIIIRIFF